MSGQQRLAKSQQNATKNTQQT